MNDNDNPKNDDWGMTMPHARLDKKKITEAAEDFAPEMGGTPTAPPVDDWGMTQANVNIPQKLNVPPSANPPASAPPSDFDKTTPNINIPSQFSGASKQGADVPPSAAPQDDWGMTQANVQLPKEEKREDWQMPQPVFRISSGEDLAGFDKTTPNVNFQKTGEDDFGSPLPNEEVPGGGTTPYFRLPENRAEPKADIDSPPPISEQFRADEVVEQPAPARTGGGNLKWVLLLGGLFGFFLVVTAGLVGAYFLFLSDSGVSVKSLPASNANKSSDATSPTVPSAAPVAETNLPSSITYKSEMVLVSAGEFTMGSDSGGDESKTAHKVTLPAFYIDKYEVTNAQYKEFCQATGKTPPPDPFWEQGYFENRPNAPVLGVSFDDAKAYASWAGKRLPTEQEWEKAASWDEKLAAKLEFPWGNTFERGKSSFGLKTTSDVGKFTGASPSGAMDMAGNVAEWVDAYFQPYPNNTTTNSAFGETNRVVRGGHFGSKTNENLKTTKRIYVPPTVASGEDEEKLFAAAIGFRCAISADDARLQEFLKK
jgi:formylglycine-generating enzyme required for sulfatase activity